MDDVLGQAMIFFNLLLIAFLVWYDVPRKLA